MRWHDTNTGGTARWAAEVLYEPCEGETGSGYWFSWVEDEPDEDDVRDSPDVLPGLDRDDLLEITIRMAPAHPDWTPTDND